MTKVLFFAVFLCLITERISCTNVTFVTCMSYTSLASSYEYYGPAIDLALDELKGIYSNIDFHKVNLSPSSIRSCAQLDDEIVNLVAAYVYDNETGNENLLDPEDLLVVVASGS